MDTSRSTRQGNRPLQRYYSPVCPRCGSTSGFHSIEIGSDSTGCLMLMFGGFIPYLLYDSSRRDKIECESCRFVFRPIKRLTKWDFIFVFLILAAILAIIIYFLVISTTR